MSESHDTGETTEVADLNFARYKQKLVSARFLTHIYLIRYYINTSDIIALNDAEIFTCWLGL
jgi:hypothetical protein